MTLNNPKATFQGQAILLTLTISEMAKDTAIVTMEGEQETVPKLSNGTIFNDREWPLTHISRSPLTYISRSRCNI